jgi:hypothetical protein
MLDGIKVNVINMPPEILFVTDSVFPKSPLPDAPFPVSPPSPRDLDFSASISQPQLGEVALYAAPSPGVIAIALR